MTNAGKNASTDAMASGAIMAQFSDEAEGYISGYTRYDWVTEWNNLSANMKLMLTTCASSLGATYLVAYDMSGYTSRGEAEDIVNINHDRALRILERLKEKEVQENITNGA